MLLFRNMKVFQMITIVLVLVPASFQKLAFQSVNNVSKLFIVGISIIMNLTLFILILSNENMKNYENSKFY